VIVIPISSEFVPQITSGGKVSTIRSGTRNYPLGPAVLRSRLHRIPVSITSIRHKNLSELRENDASNDGFPSLAELLIALRKFYPSIGDDDAVTIIEFTRRDD
jgi:hypothetical protein